MNSNLSHSGTRRIGWGPFALAGVFVVGWLLRAQLTLGPEQIVGVNGAYYLVQVRAILRDGVLGIPDFPLLFYFQAAVASVVSLFTDRNAAIIAAVRWTDTLLPVLIVFPVYFFARRLAGPYGRSPRVFIAASLVGLLAVGNGGLLKMAGDFPKNAVALPFSLLFVYSLYAALEGGKKRHLILAAVCFVLSSLTHIGAAALNGVLATLVVIVYLTTSSERQQAKGLVLGLSAATTTVFLVAAWFDPDRIESLLRVFAAPGSLFADSGLAVLLGAAQGLPPGAAFGPAGLILGNVLGLVGLAVSVTYRKEFTPGERALVVASAVSALFFSSPLLSVELLDRLALMSFVPGLIPLTFLVVRRGNGWILASPIVAVVLLSTIMSLPHARSHMLASAARDELSVMKHVLPEGTTLVVARHGLEWWAAWVLDTKIANRLSVAMEVRDEYDYLLVLDEITPNAFEWGRRLPVSSPAHGARLVPAALEPGGLLPDPGLLRSKEVTTVYVGEYFRLSLVSDFEPQPVWRRGDVGTLRFIQTAQRLGSANSYCVSLGDLDGDGDLDALVANSGSSSALWVNDGHGVFSLSDQDLGSGNCARLGDLDGDGDLDGLIAGDSNWVLLNDGRGTLTPSGRNIGDPGAASLALGDLDGDGDIDAFAAYWGQPRGQPNRVWLNDGTGGFEDSGQQLGSAASSDVSLSDIDADGDLDAFVVNQADSTHHPIPNTVWLNDGNARFTASGQTLGNACSYAAPLGDLDGDGDLDALVANSSHAQLSEPANIVWIGDGQGSFTDSGQRLGVSYSLSATLGDLDGDGDLDVFVGNYRDADRVWLNDGNGNFSDSGLPLGEANGHDIAIGDLDGDGDLDAFVANNTWQGGAGANRVWLNMTRLPER